MVGNLVGAKESVGKLDGAGVGTEDVGANEIVGDAEGLSAKSQRDRCIPMHTIIHRHVPRTLIVHAAVTTFHQALMCCALHSCLSLFVAISMSALHFDIRRPEAE